MKPPFLVPALLSTSLFVAAGAFAGGRHFALSYPPDVDRKGSLGVESWVTGFSGQDDSTNTAWENRVGVEYSLTDRLTGTTFINFAQAGPAGSSARFTGPSLQLLYALGRAGKVPLDPSVLFDAQENGDELRLQPALLLQQESGEWVLAGTVAGELEYDHHARSGSGSPHKAVYLTAGVARDVNDGFSLALEGQYSREIAESGPSPGALFLGPTLDLHTDKVGLTVGWHPQVSGTPATVGGRNLADFARSQFRMILAIDL